MTTHWGGNFGTSWHEVPDFKTPFQKTKVNFFFFCNGWILPKELLSNIQENWSWACCSCHCCQKQEWMFPFCTPISQIRIHLPAWNPVNYRETQDAIIPKGEAKSKSSSSENRRCLRRVSAHELLVSHSSPRVTIPFNCSFRGRLKKGVNVMKTENQIWQHQKEAINNVLKVWFFFNIKTMLHYRTCVKCLLIQKVSGSSLNTVR